MSADKVAPSVLPAPTGSSVPAVPRAAVGQRRPLAAQPAGVASAYDLTIAAAASLTRAAQRSVLLSPARARTAVLAAEILGPPRSVRPFGAP